MSDLSKLLKLMAENSFSNKQKKYYILIDDLDENWMPDSKIYNDLIKTLLDTANEVNRTVDNLKIVVSLREDALYRIFENTKGNEPQREKWNDVMLKLKWESDNIKNMIELRLNHIFKSQYTSEKLTFDDVFPDPHKKKKELAFKFITDRSFMRPRDTIDFINTIIEHSVNYHSGKITWATLNSAEREYSIRRYDSVLDEWKSVYPSIDVACRRLSKLGTSFHFSLLTDDVVQDIVVTGNDDSNYFFQHFQKHINDEISLSEIKENLLKIFFTTGLLGVKDERSGVFVYSFEMNIFTYPEFSENSTFTFHKMFRAALGLT